MKFSAFILLLACSVTFAGAQYTAAPKAGGLRKIVSDVYVWTDTCNVYVLRDGENALLINLGDGSVLDHLREIGVKRVEWVLFTDHHREQTQGYPRLKGWQAKVGAPEAERALFERPASFRKMRPLLGDRFTVHGSSYVRPPVQPVTVDRGFKKMDEFDWHGREIRCNETRGTSPGGMSYFLKQGAGWLAFSGDVMLDRARMHNWFDTEWDYGFASGIYALAGSASFIGSFNPSMLLPSHGPVVTDPKGQLDEFQNKLRVLAKNLVRGYSESRFGAAEQDVTSKPTAVPHVWQVSPHLFKFRAPDYWPNFYLLLSDNGHALAVDCGVDPVLLDKSIERMKEKFGLKKIDACIVTHMHGDHMTAARHMREKWGAPTWVLDNMVDKCERPERFDYVASIEAYGRETSVPVARAFKPGEILDWEGYRLTVDWMPGQTEFALCLSGIVDGRRVAFTGDNIFGNSADPEQNGHEAMVARNSAILEEGYIHGAELLQRINPDLILGGHSWVIDHPTRMIERYRKWAYDMRSAFQALSTDEDYRYWFDPYWVRAEPYRVALRPGQPEVVSINVRNFRDRRQKHHIEIHTPPGIVATPAVLDGVLEAGSRAAFQVRVSATGEAQAGVAITGMDITLDGHRYGEWFDFVVEVSH